jgi:hypothetical protein
MRAAFANLESRSVYMRFFGYEKELTDSELEQATEVDFDQVVALVATVGSGRAESSLPALATRGVPGPRRRAPRWHSS